MLAQSKKKQIIESMENLIDKQATVSLLFLLQSSLEHEYKVVSNPDLDLMPERVLSLRSEIDDGILSLESNLARLSEDEIFNKYEYYKELKKELKKIYENICYLTSRLIVVRKVFQKEQSLRYVQEENKGVKFDESRVNYEVFLGRCKEILLSMEDWEFANGVEEIYKLIPVNQSRQIFFEDLKNKLMSVLENSSRTYLVAELNSMKNMLTTKKNIPPTSFCYNVELFLQDVLELNPKDMELEEISELIFYKINKYTKYLSLVQSSIVDLHNDMSSLSIFYLLRLPFAHLTKNITYRDLYYTVCKNLKSDISLEELELYLDRISETLENSIDSELDDITVVKGKISLLFEKISKNEKFDHETELVLQMYSLVQELYFSSVDDNLNVIEVDDKEKPLPKDIIEEVIDKFLNQLQDDLKEMSSSLRKQQMQILRTLYLRSSDIDTIINELRYRLNNSQTLEEKLVFIGDISDIFDNFSYSFIPEN